MSAKTRTEQDSLGSVEVPINALFGAQTQRAVNNFQFSPWRMPPDWIQTLALIKQAAAQANAELGELDSAKAQAIQAAAEALVNGELLEHFPVDVFQTGSGTSSNMNMNEVLARRAQQQSGLDISPNDDVNRGQSSNDVIPTCNHVMAAVMVDTKLLPALRHLRERFDTLSADFGHIVKTGRTHLMDAMPISVAQEIDGWRQPFIDIEAQLETHLRALSQLTLGGTAVGTGVNAHNEIAINEPLARNPILATVLNPVIGYDAAAEIAKTAYATGRPVLDVALEKTNLTEEELKRLLDPVRLA